VKLRLIFDARRALPDRIQLTGIIMQTTVTLTQSLLVLSSHAQANAAVKII